MADEFGDPMSPMDPLTDGFGDPAAPQDPHSSLDLLGDGFGDPMSPMDPLQDWLFPSSPMGGDTDSPPIQDPLQTPQRGGTAPIEVVDERLQGGSVHSGESSQEPPVFRDPLLLLLQGCKGRRDDGTAA